MSWEYNFYLLLPGIIVIIYALGDAFKKKKKKKKWVPPMQNAPAEPKKPKERFRFFTNGDKEARTFAKNLKNKYESMFDKIVEFTDISVEFTFNRKSPDRKMLLDVAFVARIDKDVKAKFSLRSMPGCGSIVISHNTWVSEELRGKGLASVMMAMKRDIVQEWGSNKIIATVVANNDKEKAILVKQGWKLVDTFQNSQTDNPVEVWSKTLDVKPKKTPDKPVSEEGNKDEKNGGEAVASNDTNTAREPK